MHQIRMDKRNKSRPLEHLHYTCSDRQRTFAGTPDSAAPSCRRRARRCRRQWTGRPIQGCRRQPCWPWREPRFGWFQTPGWPQWFHQPVCRKRQWRTSIYLSPIQWRCNVRWTMSWLRYRDFITVVVQLRPETTVIVTPYSVYMVSRYQGIRYLNCVNSKMAGHAAGSVLDGNSLSAPPEGAGLLWVVFPMIVCKTLCIFSVAFHDNPIFVR